MRFNPRVFFSLLLILLLAAPAGAAQAGKLDPEAPHVIAARLAEASGYSVEEITALAEAGFGYGEIAKAITYAAATGETLSDALLLAESVEWGELFKAAGISAGKKGLGWLRGSADGEGEDEGEEEGEAGEGEGRYVVAQRLAEASGYSVEELSALVDAGYGYGNIARAIAYAQATGVSLSEALALAAEVGWGQAFKAAEVPSGKNGLGWLLHNGAAQSTDGEGDEGEGGSEPTPFTTQEDEGPGKGKGKDKDKDKGGGPPDHAGPKK